MSIRFLFHLICMTLSVTQFQLTDIKLANLIGHSFNLLVDDNVMGEFIDYLTDCNFMTLRFRIQSIMDAEAKNRNTNAIIIVGNSGVIGVEGGDGFENCVGLEEMLGRGA